MKKVLIVVDFQKDFVDGSLGFPQAAALDGLICRKIAAYRAEGADVLYTFDTHREGYLGTREGKNLPVLHCLEGTEGWRLYGQTAQIAAEKEERGFCKATFGSLELALYLKENAYESVELVGLVSHICVLSNAVLAQAALPEARIIVDASCTAGYNGDLHEKTLDLLSNIQIEVSNR